MVFMMAAGVQAVVVGVQAVVAGVQAVVAVRLKPTISMLRSCLGRGYCCSHWPICLGGVIAAAAGRELSGSHQSGSAVPALVCMRGGWRACEAASLAREGSKG
eukprot:359050-Chlamydomonas_euryale.AAC.2